MWGTVERFPYLHANCPSLGWWATRFFHALRSDLDLLCRCSSAWSGDLGRAFDATGSYASLPVILAAALGFAAAMNLLLPSYSVHQQLILPKRESQSPHPTMRGNLSCWQFEFGSAIVAVDKSPTLLWHHCTH